MTTIKLSNPSPAEKAEMIRRHFPALLPRFNPDTGNIECPSMTDRDTLHTITKHQSADGSIMFRCDCHAGQHGQGCTHLELVPDVQPVGLIGQTVHVHTDAAFDERWQHVMKATA